MRSSIINKIHKFFPKIFITIFSLIVAFLVLEVSFRIYSIKLQEETLIAKSLPEDFWNRYDPVLGFRHIPGKIVRQAYKEIPVSINKQGFRAEIEYDLKRKKILAMGCSFTFGHGIAGQDAWPQQLEDKLKSNGFDYDVINMGACAYGLDQTYLWFLEQQKKLKPDIVILGMADTLNRIVRDRLKSGQGKPRFKVVGDKLVLANVPVPKRIQPGKVIRNWQSTLFDFKKSYFADFVIERLVIGMQSRDSSAESLQIAEKILQAIAHNCKQNNCKFIVVLIDPVARVKEILIRNKIDFTESFESLAGKKGVYLKNDCHQSSFGHELIARHAYNFLLEHKEKYLLY